MDGGARRGRSCRRDFGADDDLGSLRRSRCCKDRPTTAAGAERGLQAPASNLAGKYDAYLQKSMHFCFTQLGCTYFKRRYRRIYKWEQANGRGWQTSLHEVETNNWYNDISTRDRSREGAEEAIDLSLRFQKPELKTRPRPPGRAGARAALGACGKDVVSVQLPER